MWCCCGAAVIGGVVVGGVISAVVGSVAGGIGRGVVGCGVVGFGVKLSLLSVFFLWCWWWCHLLLLFCCCCCCCCCCSNKSVACERFTKDNLTLLASMPFSRRCIISMIYFHIYTPDCSHTVSSYKPSPHVLLCYYSFQTLRNNPTSFSSIPCSIPLI